MKMEHRYSTKAFWQKVKDEYHPTWTSQAQYLFSWSTFSYMDRSDDRKEFRQFCANHATNFLLYTPEGKWFMDKYEGLGDAEIVSADGGFLFRLFPYINYNLQIRYKFIDYVIKQLESAE